jgi:opacity protein-like surface antigen
MLRTGLLAAASISASVACAGLAEADGPPTALGGAFTWNGIYMGLQMGGAWGEAHVSDPFGSSIYGDNIHTRGPLAGGAIGANWQKGTAVIGIEADANWADIEGTNTCFAFSGFFVSANCRFHVDAFGTLAARLGVAAGPTGRTLLYVKGGGTWEDKTVAATAGGGAGTPTTSASGITWGWTVGAGVEHALRGGWSVKAEYDYLAFGNSGLAAPASLFQNVPPNPFFIPVPGRGANTSQDIQEFKVGLNYRLGAEDRSADDGWRGVSLKDGFSPRTLSGTELEMAARYVYGWGRFQKDWGIPGLSIGNLRSRLTYDGMDTNGGELFARLDTGNSIMIKGLIGAGSGGGHLNDEDWLLFGKTIPYSNTLSQVDNRVEYATIDVGYDALRGNGYKVAAYVGYNVLTQSMKASGCAQIADLFSNCVPPIPASVLGITEKDTWQALRLGSAADFFVLPQVKVSADAAYLPYVWFDGTDNHVRRALLSPEDGHGQGVQLDLMVSYAVTDRFNLGVGGRYWSMWTTRGELNFGGSFIIPQRFTFEQAAVLVQGSYKFGD